MSGLLRGPLAQQAAARDATQPFPELEGRETAATAVTRLEVEPARPIVLVMGAYDAGGSAIYTANLAVELARLGRQVAVICPRVDAFPDIAYQREAIRSLIAQMRTEGVGVHDIERVDLTVRDRVAGLRNLVRVLRAYRGCVVVLVMGYFIGGGRWAVAGRLAGARAVVRVELATPMAPITARERATTRIKDILVDRLVVGSQGNRSDLATFMRRRSGSIGVIHTGIDVSLYVPGRGRAQARLEMGIESSDLAVGMVARLSAEAKGVGFFLRGAATAASSNPALRFVVVGDGHLKERFEREARALGLNDRVRFPGWRGDIVSTLAAFDLFVMPSSSEGGPTVLIEAMAMALPVIATPVGMVPEIVANGVSGAVCPYGDDHRLADLIRQMAVDEPRRQRMGLAARHYVGGQLTLRGMAERYAELLDSL